ncbi:unnamed protein product, partial [Discosporangium mesarthrocarpum]
MSPKQPITIVNEGVESGILNPEMMVLPPPDDTSLEWVWTTGRNHGLVRAPADPTRTTREPDVMEKRGKGGAWILVLFFWVSHTAAVYANKMLFILPGRTLHTVVLVTWGQCAVSCCLILALRSLGKVLAMHQGVSGKGHDSKG